MSEIRNKEGELLHQRPESGERGHYNLNGLCLIEAVLDGEDFFGVYLNQTNLSGADLLGCKFDAAELHNANLRNVNLRTAHFSFINLYFTSLSGADLSYAAFHDVVLKGTLLNHAALEQTSFLRVDFTDAELTGAVLNRTRFAFCDNLHKAEGLAHIQHDSPSSLDQHTLRGSIHGLPDVFLNGVGYSDREIKVLRELYAAED